MHQQYGDRIDFVGVSGRDDLDAMDGFIAEHGLDGFEHVFDDELALWIAFGVNNQPAFVFIDADGNADVAIRMLGEAGIAARLDDLLAAA